MLTAVAVTVFSPFFSGSTVVRNRGSKSSLTFTGATIFDFLVIFFGIEYSALKEVIVAVVVGFSRTGDGHDHRQGAHLHQADS